MSTPRYQTESSREPVNGWLHLGAAVLAGVGLIVLGANAAEHDSWRHTTGAVVFGVSAILMFGASALYHLARGSLRGPLYRRLDHAMIYIFIAGSFTPVCLVALHGSAMATPLLVSVWALAIMGVLQEVAWRGAPRRLSTWLYLGLGWLGALSAFPLLRTSQVELLAWLIAGGLLYTVGAMIYHKRWPRGVPGVFGFHELWHVFVIAACASHYWAVLNYVIA